MPDVERRPNDIIRRRPQLADDTPPPIPSRRTFLAHLGAASFGGLIARTLPLRAADGETIFGFREVPRGVDATHHVPPGYRTDILLRWGDPLSAGTGPWRPGQPDPEGDSNRFGFNNDFVAYFPFPGTSAPSQHGLLCVNHEYSSPAFMWPDTSGTPLSPNLSFERTASELAALGHSVVEVAFDDGHWHYRISNLNRRTTMHTPVAIAGPAAGHRRMRNSFHPDGTTTLGVLGVCGGGKTPWGTVLIAEENFNFYFSGRSKEPTEKRSQQRYGVSRWGRYRHWAEHYPRYRADLHPTVANGYGWVVEIDPYRPDRIPVKRTALGRFKHESANCVLNRDGRVVVYSGDDEIFEYIYRFVSHERFDSSDRENNFRLLDDGILSVARFEAGGRVDWIDLIFDQGPLTPENGFNDQGDVLIDTRRAADLVGATRMDRPEEIETNPTTGAVYVLLTNNVVRGPNDVDAANPRAINRFGHILRLLPPGAPGDSVDHAAGQFAWEVVLLAGDPADSTHAADYPVPVSADGWFAAPDNCAFDAQGHLWIATDQGRNWGWTGSADGLWACDLHGPGSGVIKRFFRAPIGAEVCGPEFTPDGRTLFLAIQHPGVDGVRGASFTKPGTRWPDFKPDTPARSSVIAITREDGGVIGS